MSENVKDFIGMMIVTAMVIVFGTNLVTDNYNVWALMVQFAN